MKRLHPDPNLKQAEELVRKAMRGGVRRPQVKAFFDEPTFTASYVIHDPETKTAAILRIGRIKPLFPKLMAGSSGRAVA